MFHVACRLHVCAESSIRRAINVGKYDLRIQIAVGTLL